MKTPADARQAELGLRESAGLTALKERRDEAAAISRLCGNADFRLFLRNLLDDLGAFAFDAAPLSDFTQGIRASAQRIKERCLIADEAAAMLAGFDSKAYAERHEAFISRQKEGMQA